MQTLNAITYRNHLITSSNKTVTGPLPPYSCGQIFLHVSLKSLFQSIFTKFNYFFFLNSSRCVNYSWICHTRKTRKTIVSSYHFIQSHLRSYYILWKNPLIFPKKTLRENFKLLKPRNRGSILKLRGIKQGLLNLLFSSI